MCIPVVCIQAVPIVDERCLPCPMDQAVLLGCGVVLRGRLHGEEGGGGGLRAALSNGGQATLLLLTTGRRLCPLHILHKNL
jgi:hypothetical protein